MSCGHACERKCHFVDAQHIDRYKKCPKTCDLQTCQFGHQCPKNCHFGDECGTCTKIVTKIHPKCKHAVQVACTDDPSMARCAEQCGKDRPCGHQCKNVCGVNCELMPCQEIVEKRSPCGHFVAIKCMHFKDDLELLDACTEPCGIELKCGHLCKGSCGRCRLGRLHIA